MSDTKILQAILDGQVAIRKDIKETKDSLSQKIETNGKRIDKIGLNLAELSDDAPTVEEFDDLEKRVGKLEKQAASV